MIDLQLGDTVEILPPINRPGSPKIGTVVFIFQPRSEIFRMDFNEQGIGNNQLMELKKKHTTSHIGSFWVMGLSHTSYLILVPTGKSGQGKGRLLYPPVSRLRKLPTRQAGMQGFHER